MKITISAFSNLVVTRSQPRKQVSRPWWIFMALGLLFSLPCSPTCGAEETGTDLPNLQFGDGNLRLGLELRVRTESWNGYTVKGPGKDLRDHAILFRSKFLAEYLQPQGMHLLLELQDSRYGYSLLKEEDFPATCPFKDQLDIRRAFIETPVFGKEKLKLKVGRQTITYADKRIFGPGNWGNVGRYWWDAVKLSFRVGNVRTDFLWGQRVIREVDRLDTRHDPYHMLGLYSRIGQGKRQLHLFFLERREDKESSGEVKSGFSRVDTAGFWFSRPLFQHWEIQGTTAMQRGRRGGDSLRAWGANMRVRYEIPGRFKPYAGLELTIGSGDRNPADGVSGTFDGVFGSVSGAYGRMNLFSWKNLRDYQFTFGIRVRRGLNIWLDVHHFELDSSHDAWYWCSGKPQLLDVDGNFGRQLGNELDLLAKVQLAANWEFFTGAAIFRGGSYLEQDSSIGRRLSWGFVQMLYRF